MRDGYVSKRPREDGGEIVVSEAHSFSSLDSVKMNRNKNSRQRVT